MTRIRAEQTLHKYYCMLESDYQMITDKEVKIHVIPVHNQETKIECIYPPVIKDGKIESEIIKLYRLLLNNKDNNAKTLIRNFDRKIKLIKLIKFKKK